jgi:NADH:ubiquinone oxidoreductase subunit 4 (subunit M)
LLKTAAYGLLRFALPLFPNASAEFAPIAMWLGVIGIFYGAWMAFTQYDIKRLIAYTSVSHMGFVLIAIYTGSQLAYQGGDPDDCARSVRSRPLHPVRSAVRTSAYPRYAHDGRSVEQN